MISTSLVNAPPRERGNANQAKAAQFFVLKFKFFLNYNMYPIEKVNK